MLNLDIGRPPQGPTTMACQSGLQEHTLQGRATEQQKNLGQRPRFIEVQQMELELQVSAIKQELGSSFPKVKTKSPVQVCEE